MFLPKKHIDLRSSENILKHPHCPPLSLQSPFNRRHCMAFIVVVVNQVAIGKMQGVRLSVLELNLVPINLSSMQTIIPINQPRRRPHYFCHIPCILHCPNVVFHTIQRSGNSSYRTDLLLVKIAIITSPGTKAGQKRRFLISAPAKTPTFWSSTNAFNTQKPESRTT